MITLMSMTCPHCGAHLTGHAGSKGRPPQGGDMALCWSCRRLSVAVSTPAGIMLRAATQDEGIQAARDGWLIDAARAMRYSSDPIEAGLRYQQLKSQRKDMA